MTARGTEGRDIFLDDIDRNHFHLMGEVGEAPLGRPIQRLLSRYANRFNRRYGRIGHLFQRRYEARLCESTAYLIQLLSYIHRNPVRAGIVMDPAAWAWSSHQGLMGRTSDPILDLDALCDAFGGGIEDLRAAYLEALALAEVRGSTHDTDKPPLDELAAQAAREFGLDSADLLSGRRGPDFTRARLALIKLAATCGYRTAELANRLGCMPNALTRLKNRHR